MYAVSRPASDFSPGSGPSSDTTTTMNPDDWDPTPRATYADQRTDTLAVSYDWGISLLRPYSKIIDPRARHLIKVAILHYHVFLEKNTSDINNVSFGHQAVANSRICQVMNAQGTSSKKEHVFVIDLDSRRLDTHKTVREHPFEDVKVWHIQTRVFQQNGSAHEAGRERWSDRLLHVHLDATTVWTNHYNAGLEYIDIGSLTKFSHEASANRSAEDSAVGEP
ncbi:hypothetical protein IE81DRAFT_246894 [Ceraceosorus guamensis]|uniref:Uncharacterized protein n=1 Tax=Ceraceosorus guamensis TaxID=1522189 RepID=A0A316VSM2_9BASI|nr:hypothetical protein IE81DRAFT_246894 [Ceraceosorus guamensis]PWN40038.1 hypothetical protein IE81DRAFT_246894 [Ceraceosorus guamensis]